MVLDSNVLINYLNGDRRVAEMLELWREQGFSLFISTITVAEVLSFPTVSTDRELDELRTFLKTFVPIPMDNKIAEIAAVLRRVYRLKLPDATIAATALFLKQPLASRDRGLKKIKEIEVQLV